MKAADLSQGINPDQLERAAERLGCLTHPMRLSIVELLQENTKMSVTEIYKAIKLEQAATSHHLKILKEKGILASRRDGKKIYYSLKAKSLKNVMDAVNKCCGE